MTNLSVYVGWDPREVDAYDVCVGSLRKNSSVDIEIRKLSMDELRADGLYDRITETRDGRLWDAISEAPMATEFAITRFFVPMLAERDGAEGDWALFCDCDFLWTGDIAELIAELDPSKAVMCVKHKHEPVETTKMDGQMQLLYARKNWSSMMVFNRRHPANAKLTLEMLNGLPGRDLHRFCWLEDDQIGAVSMDWNWLEGHSPKGEAVPRVIHYTRGGPWMAGWENVEYGDLWLGALAEIRATA
jgi:lipopolysaccharide biosynthesis glycosyltransferase